MKKSLIFIAAALPLLSFSTEGAQTAQARLYCLSLKFQRGTEPYDLFSLDLTTISSGNNGELAMDFNGSYSHYSYLTMHDETFFEDIPGNLFLDVPLTTDVNHDGFPDFFDVSQGVNTTTTGQYTIAGYGSGTIQARWSRSPDSRFGTCVLDFKMNLFQSLAVFTHPFEVLEYKGPVTYTPASNIVSASLDLKQTGNPTRQLQGAAQFAKVAADPANQLDLLPGGWTNELFQVLSFPTNYVDRDAPWPTNYYGYVGFDDGDPNTGEEDYWLWLLSIDDLNDHDEDGIPDLSDDPAVVKPPRRPGLALTRGSTNLWLTLQGDVGRLHHIQQGTNVISPGWETVLSLTLTNDPQTVSLPLPAAEVQFWRAWAE